MREENVGCAVSKLVTQSRSHIQEWRDAPWGAAVLDVVLQLDALLLFQLLRLSRRFSATENIPVQWVLVAFHPRGFPFDNGSRVMAHSMDEQWPPLLVPWVTMGSPIAEWSHPIRSVH